MDTLKIREKFASLYGSGGAMYTSPGRINIIGEHTDYNGGFVLPGAIDKAMYCEIKPNGTKKIRAFALDVNESCEFGLEEADKPTKQWACYIFGMCREMANKGKTVLGFDTVFAGDVPLGAGMSSSAALESCFGYALNDLYNLGFSRMEIALMGQATEHNYVGIKCGIMDQFASCHGKEGYLMKLDCRSLEFEYVPFNPKGYRVVLINTCVEHNLAAGGEYNKRRQSCENVVAEIAKMHPEVKLLRDANMDMLKAVKGKVSAVDYMRAEFVVGEVQRLLDACAAMEKDDYETVGKKMYETHEGLSKKYEVSCPELDFLNDMAKECGVTGSRVMGGGFGGCTINLVKTELYDAFIKKTTEAYEKKFNIKPKVYDVVIKNGAAKL
ncbi:MAG: galactokinase [Cytophagaceae bacterium]|jgi:galactokinase|nr:galactokinase [Cytophagaceae bacterium]